MGGHIRGVGWYVCSMCQDRNPLLGRASAPHVLWNPRGSMAGRSKAPKPAYIPPECFRRKMRPYGGGGDTQGQ